MPKQNINFKDPLWIVAWLDTALKKEKEKYAKCPIIPDMVRVRLFCDDAGEGIGVVGRACITHGYGGDSALRWGLRTAS